MQLTPELIGAIITALATLVVGYWQWTKSKEAPVEIHKKSLKSHPFFAQVDFWVTHVAPNIAMDDKKRRRCVRVFLILKLTVFKNRLLEQVEEIESGRGDICSIPSKFLEWCKEYEDQARNAGVPHIFIIKFAEWHESCMQSTFACCTNLCGACMFHPDDVDKMGAILDIMMFAFQDTMLSAETTLDNLNGDLSSKLESDFNNRQGLWRVDA